VILQPFHAVAGTVLILRGHEMHDYIRRTGRRLDDVLGPLHFSKVELISLLMKSLCIIDMEDQRAFLLALAWDLSGN